MIIYTQFWRAKLIIYDTIHRAKLSKLLVEPHFGHPLYLAMNNNFVCLTSVLFQVSLTWINTKWMEWPPLSSVPYVLVWSCYVTGSVRTDLGQGKSFLDSNASLHGQLLSYYKIGLLATIICLSKNVDATAIWHLPYGQHNFKFSFVSYSRKVYAVRRHFHFTYHEKFP